MNWINLNRSKFKARQTNYNKCVCMHLDSLNHMVDNFDTIFSNYTKFNDEISSVHLYPFLIGFVHPPEGTRPLLTTAKGVSDTNALEINDASSYLSFGEIFISPRFNNYADYKGYTQIRAFLPFVGYVDIDTNMCMGKWLQFRLCVDYHTAKGLFIVGVSDNSITHEIEGHPTNNEDDAISVISTFECNVGIDIPLGSSNAAEIKRNLLLGTLKIAAGVTSSIVTMSPAPAVSTTVSTIEPTVKTYDIKGRGQYKGARMKQMKSGTEVTTGGSKTTTTVHHKPVNETKPVSEIFDGSIDVLNRSYVGSHTDRVNDANLMWNMSSNVHVIIYRPKLVPQDENYGALYGYPLGSTHELGDLTGYTEINAIHIEGAGFETITNKEVALLEEVFANGIIL